MRRNIVGRFIARVPGRADINDQFTGAHLSKSLRHLKKLLKDGNGDYLFGSLTAAYYGFLPGTPDYISWMEEAAVYDPPAREAIKKGVIAAVTNHPKPLPITFEWDQTGTPKGVTVTPNSSPPTSYTIKITGYPAPKNSALADRKKKT